MRFSVLTVSMLATSAAAWRWPHRGGYHVVTEVVTVAAPTVTEYASEVATAAPTTLVTKKVTATKKVTTSTTATAAAQSAASTSSSSSSDSSLTSDQQAALDAHNKAREEVGTADLTWSADLASDAQTWADHLASIGSLTHSGVSDQGENLYMQSGTDSPFLNAVNAFLEEKSSYNGEAITSTNYMTFGHYTQCVWKDTTQVGMAVASGSSGTYVVARYSPPGNYIGETAY